MKLVEILARELNDWPEDCTEAIQCYKPKSKMIFFYGCGGHFDREFSERASDAEDASVTRSQWEAERARILLESQPERDADVAKVVDAGKCRNKEDQALWDEVYLQSQKMFFDAARDLDCIDDIAYRIGKWADAFMAERAKRMKG